jgi:hypothetical protein
MPDQRTKAWMRRDKLKAITVYLYPLVFERVEAAAKGEGRSKGSWIRQLVLETLRCSGPDDH